MTTLIEIKQAVSQLLQKKYHYKVYGNEVKEGYTVPSFFLELIPKKILNETINYTNNAYTIKITYFQETESELDSLKKIDEIKEMLGMKLKVGARLLGVSGFTYDFVGQKNNVLQAGFDIEYYERRKKEETNEPARDIVWEYETEE